MKDRERKKEGSKEATNVVPAKDAPAAPAVPPAPANVRVVELQEVRIPLVGGRVVSYFGDPQVDPATDTPDLEQGVGVRNFKVAMREEK